MTKDEIKKALEFCAQDNYYFCGGCSYDDVRNCNDKLKTDALNVIIEQEKEIERLKTKIIKQDQTIIESNFELSELEEKNKQVQIDVLNKLRRRAWQGYQIGMYIVSTQEIDELIKEVENDNRRN